LDGQKSNLDFPLNAMSHLRNTGLGRAVKVLPQVDRRKLVIVAILQTLLGGLDLLGVIAIGLLGALSVNGLQSTNPGDRVSAVLEILHIQDATFQQQTVFLGMSALILLVGRTILSIFFMRRTLFFLSRSGAKISAELISRLLSQPLLIVQSRTTQETVYAVTTGVERVVLQVLATVITCIADLALLLVMMVGLLVVDPLTATSVFLAFFLVGYFLYKFMHVRAGSLGVENSSLNIKSNEKIVEVFASYRESVVRNRRDYYAREMGHLRHSISRTSAELAFLPYVSKYVIETTVVVGSVLIASVQFFYQDASHAIATLAVFLAAGTRIAPAVLRLQQGIVTVKSGLGLASPTLDLIEVLGNTSVTANIDDKVDVVHEGFIAEVSISDVTLVYPNKIMPAIANISLRIPAGTSVAFVGPSGAGKTTIVDVLLGVLNPDSGSVLVSGLPPLIAVAKWPGAVSYVPQDVAIAAGTIRENIALGYPIEEATDELVSGALNLAHLGDFVGSLPNGIDTQVGERGARLSGGQRQRLGIARAMFTRPHLLVLDEATSSLDGETEAIISDAINELRGSTTVVIVAHRLSTVRNADMVVYISDGRMLASGTFEDVRKAVPDFDHQARIMGL
jgi:ABC-type multidrug transport system fused ATPase/permease subunit